MNEIELKVRADGAVNVADADASCTPLQINECICDFPPNFGVDVEPRLPLQANLEKACVGDIRFQDLKRCRRSKIRSRIRFLTTVSQLSTSTLSSKLTRTNFFTNLPASPHLYEINWNSILSQQAISVNRVTMNTGLTKPKQKVSRPAKNWKIPSPVEQIERGLTRWDYLKGKPGKSVAVACGNKCPPLDTPSHPVSTKSR